MNMDMDVILCADLIGPCMSEDKRSLMGRSYVPGHTHWREHLSDQASSVSGNATSSSWGDQRRSSAHGPDTAAFARALVGFVVSLLIYFCFLHCLCDGYGEATKKEVDKNIVKKVRNLYRMSYPEASSLR